MKVKYNYNQVMFYHVVSLDTVVFSITDAVLNGEKIPEGVEIKADKKLILEFVKVRNFP